MTSLRLLMISVRCHFSIQCAGPKWWEFTFDLTSLDDPSPKGITSYFNLLMQRAKIEGFIV